MLLLLRIANCVLRTTPFPHNCKDCLVWNIRPWILFVEYLSTLLRTYVIGVIGNVWENSILIKSLDTRILNYFISFWHVVLILSIYSIAPIDHIISNSLSFKLLCISICSDILNQLLLVLSSKWQGWMWVLHNEQNQQLIRSIEFIYLDNLSMNMHS